MVTDIKGREMINARQLGETTTMSMSAFLEEFSRKNTTGFDINRITTGPSVGQQIDAQQWEKLKSAIAIKNQLLEEGKLDLESAADFEKVVGAIQKNKEAFVGPATKRINELKAEAVAAKAVEEQKSSVAGASAPSAQPQSQPRQSTSPEVPGVRQKSGSSEVIRISGKDLTISVGDRTFSLRNKVVTQKPPGGRM